MKSVVCLIFAIIVACMMLSDAFPQRDLSSLSHLGNVGGSKVLLHTSGIEKGHRHTANCFGFGQRGGAQTTAATTTTTAASG